LIPLKGLKDLTAWVRIIHGMDTLLLVLLGFGLFCLWLFALLVIILYRCSIVPKRLDDIVNVFFVTLPEGKTPLSDNRGKTAAWHYARLLGRLPPPGGGPPNPPDQKPPERVIIEDQFWHYHSWKRYWPPLLLILFVTGAALTFTGVWVADDFRNYVLKQSQSGRRSTNETGRISADTNTLIRANFPASTGIVSAANSDAPKTGTKTNAPAGGSSPNPDPSSRAEKERPDMVGAITDTIVLALWGGLIWSLYEILSRRKSGDLTPTELWDVVFRLLAAIPTGYAFAVAGPKDLGPVIAFAVSAFPYRDLRHILRRQTLRKLGEDVQNSAARPSEGHIGTSLSGLSDDMIVRLGELNIVTFYDLAYADPVRLMVRTGAPPRLIMAWIDQALLAVYAEKLKEKFTALGMPCSLDMCEFYTQHCYDCATEKMKSRWEENDVVKVLADKVGVDARILVLQPMRSIFEDQQTQFLIRVWYGPQWDPNRM